MIDAWAIADQRAYWRWKIECSKHGYFVRRKSKLHARQVMWDETIFCPKCQWEMSENFPCKSCMLNKESCVLCQIKEL